MTAAEKNRPRPAPRPGPDPRRDPAPDGTAPAASGAALRWILFGLLLAACAFLLARPVDLSTADLGRHLKNGELLATSFTIPGTNLYSYTYPDYPFVNHHWGSGAVFYLVQRLAGFAGLQVFFILLSLATLAGCFLMAWRRSTFETAAIVSLPALGILVTRPEIRPEAFSYCLATIFLWLLWQHRSREVAPRTLFALPALMLLWVNLHIYFFFGLLLIGLFLLDELWTLIRARTDPARAKTLGIVLAAALVATLVNPSGLRGALYPLRIFGNYGHTIFENQSLPWVEANYGFPAGIYFKLAFALLVLSWVYALAARRELSPALLLLSLVLSVLGWQAIRNFGIFGYLTLPITASNFAGLEKKLPRAAAKPAVSALLVVLAACGIVALRPDYWTRRGPAGIGLRTGVDGAARFFESKRLAGPVFNNYDLGGYLIYYLYPRERVFVDNRPEAYPASFFTDTYVPLQERPAEWERAMGRYGFNTIVFTRASLATWARRFLADRAADPAWAAVYVDSWNVVFVRRDGPDRGIVRDYELCLAGYRPAGPPLPAGR